MAKPPDYDGPSEAELLAGILAGTANASKTATLRPVLVRLPETMLAQIDAMARLAGKSRSGMCVLLMQVGIEETVKHLPPDVSDKVNDIQGDRLTHLMENTEDREPTHEAY